MPRFAHTMNPNANAMRGVATETRVKLSKANDWSRPAQAQPVVAVGSPQQAPVQPANQASSCTPVKAQGALPSYRSVAGQPSTAPPIAIFALRHGLQPVHGHRAVRSAEREAPVESLAFQNLRVYPRRGLTPLQGLTVESTSL